MNQLYWKKTKFGKHSTINKKVTFKKKKKKLDPCDKLAKQNKNLKRYISSYPQKRKKERKQNYPQLFLNKKN